MTRYFRNKAGGDYDRMLLPSEVADMFGVNCKTVARWARAGQLPHITTQGGHRRYSEVAILQIIADRTRATYRV